MKHLRYLGSSSLGFHKLHATYFEPSENHAKLPVICVHGLARNARDFDVLGTALSQSWHRPVCCPDIVGRGESDWLADGSLYAFAQYTADITALLARLGADRVDWVGTSMGGLLGMFLASMPNSPIRRLVMNDVGPVLFKGPMKRIAGYMMAKQPVFKNERDLEFYLRKIYAGFGDLTDEQWTHMTRHSARDNGDGTLSLSYDPAIWNFKEPETEADMDMWPVYDAVKAKVMVLRGAESNILPPDVANEMTQRGPKAELRIIPNTAHAPALMDDDQIRIVADFLAKED